MSFAIDHPRMKLFAQIVRFATVGAIATAIHVTVALLANGAAGIAPLSANLMAFLAAWCWSYAGHAFWTFGVRTSHRQSLPKFLALSLCGFLLNQAIVYLVVVRAGLPMAAGVIPAVIIVAALTYWFSRAHVFMASVAE